LNKKEVINAQAPKLTPREKIEFKVIPILIEKDASCQFKTKCSARFYYMFTRFGNFLRFGNFGDFGNLIFSRMLENLIAGSLGEVN